MSKEIAYTKEGKQIIDIYKKMTPWDRVELMEYIAFHVMTGDEYNAFIGSDDNKSDDEDFDPISEVINRELEDNMLNAIDDDVITRYICNNQLIDKVLKKEIDEEAISDALSKLPSSKLYGVLCKLSIMTNKVEIGQLELKKF